MLRFSIRDLLWLTLLAAFAVAWFMDRTRLETQRQAMEKQQAALTAQLEAKRRLVLIQTVLSRVESQLLVDELPQSSIGADQLLEPFRAAERLDESTVRYLQAVRDPQNGYHYPVIWRD